MPWNFFQANNFEVIKYNVILDVVKYSSNVFLSLFEYIERSLGGGGVWIQLFGEPGGQRSFYSRFTWMYLECARGLSAFDDTGSLGFPPCGVVYNPGFTLGDCLQFPCREKGGWAETYRSLFTPTFLRFPVFPLLLTPRDIVSSSNACWGYSLIIITIIIIIIWIWIMCLLMDVFWQFLCFILNPL